MRTVLVVDDHEGFRAYAVAFLIACGFRVVGEVADGASAIEAAGRLRPDVVLLDVQLPDLDGLEVARRLLAPPAPPRIVLVSTREAADYGHRMEGIGVAGFVTKSALTAASLERVLR